MSELAKIMIDGISLETLLEVYYKDLKRREKIRQANMKYRATEKGKEVNRKAVNAYHKRKREAKKAKSIVA